MRLVDTSAWIEWLIDSRNGKAIAAALPQRDEWLVPTIVQLELAKWLTREVGEDKADQVIAFTEKCVVVPLDTRLALAAAEVSTRYKLAIADAIIYATAQMQGADIVTCDQHFEGLPGALLIPKTGT
jgi:predicted nucleic acid-binding protein